MMNEEGYVNYANNPTPLTILCFSIVNINYNRV